MNKAFDKEWLVQHGAAFQTGLEVALPLIAAVAGTAMQFEGAAQSQRAMNERMQQELQRQQGFQNKGQSIFAKSLTESTPVSREKQIAQGQQQAAQNYAKLGSLPLGGDVVSAMPISDKTIQQNVADYTGPRQAAGSYLQGLGTYSTDQYVKDVLANALLGVNAGQARFSESVLPLELQQAQAKGARTAAIGKLLASLGSATSSYGTAAANTGGTSTTAIPSNPYWQNVAGAGTPAAVQGVYPGIDAYNLNSLYGGYY